MVQKKYNRITGGKMKRIIIDHIDMMSQEDEEKLKKALSDINITYHEKTVSEKIKCWKCKTVFEPCGHVCPECANITDE